MSMKKIGLKYLISITCKKREKIAMSITNYKSEDP